MSNVIYVFNQNTSVSAAKYSGVKKVIKSNSSPYFAKVLKVNQ